MMARKENQLTWHIIEKCMTCLPVFSGKRETIRHFTKLVQI